jgi:hypothetical protein
MGKAGDPFVYRVVSFAQPICREPTPEREAPVFKSAVAFCLVLAGSLLAGPSHAAVMEIPLPALLGTYPIDAQHAERTASLVLPSLPAVIYGASLRISGTTVTGTITCDPDPPGDWPIDFLASMGVPSHHWLGGGFAGPTGSFTWVYSFQAVPINGTTWDFLLDGEADVTLWGAPASTIPECMTAGSPTATVTEAVFIIDAEFPTAVETTTWGRIKSLYRNP